MTGYTTFGGTSGATPIVAGHVGLTIQMWTEGAFGNQLEHAREERFLNRPQFTTTKALLINTAKQYEFSGLNHDATRTHQGWGFPDVKTMYSRRDNMLIINESVILRTLETNRQEVQVKEGATDLTLTLVYADPVGVVGAQIQRVNDLDLKVTAPDGKIYWGNFGLTENMYSVADGVKDSLNTVENVILRNPMAGTWTVEVTAAEINQDGHTETEALDTDFALVVSQQ
jgi:serine protease AprX